MVFVFYSFFKIYLLSDKYVSHPVLGTRIKLRLPVTPEAEGGSSVLYVAPIPVLQAAHRDPTQHARQKRTLFQRVRDGKAERRSGF